MHTIQWPPSGGARWSYVDFPAVGTVNAKHIMRILDQQNKRDISFNQT